MAGKIRRVPPDPAIPWSGVANAPWLWLGYGVASLAAGRSSHCHALGG